MYMLQGLYFKASFNGVNFSINMSGIFVWWVYQGLCTLMTEKFPQDTLFFGRNVLHSWQDVSNDVNNEI